MDAAIIRTAERHSGDGGGSIGVALTPGIAARELARVHVISVASPSYRLGSFAFRNRAGEQASVEMRPRVILTEPKAITRAALMDLGVALVAVPHALPHLSSGSLRRFLPDGLADAGPISLYLSGLKPIPAKTWVFGISWQPNSAGWARQRNSWPSPRSET